MSSIILSHLRSNRRCLQISMGLATNCWKRKDYILDQLDINKTYILMNTNTRPMIPILVPNLSHFQITGKTDNRDIIEAERDVRVVKEAPGVEGSSVAMRLDFRIIRDPRSYTHLTVIRRRKMSKHKRKKWRRKMLAFLKKKYLRRNIKKEKTFRAELLAQIKEAEEFDAEKYVQNILQTIDSMPQEDTREQKIEKIKDLIRKNRKETNLIPPKFLD
ncbi:unnamed protein product [Oppiella nova]|uniref:Mitochondrial mRNA-processing protein COX24 C-terminal domain-containing protein n=1 Tax=Oppiella nova TaxID=334625 RepID=A0A7R9LT97_9ACAR|nr:unnamed protein product [Oppiella nova]CAG2166169.1 unnamed protein product [Oppiella nova]